MRTDNFLLEIYCEDIPPSYLKPACDQLFTIVSSFFKEKDLTFEKINNYYTPRRLVLIIKNLQLEQEDMEIEVKGPSYKIAFDDNKPTKALLGFLRKNETDLSEVYKKTTKKGDFTHIKKTIKGDKTINLLANAIPVWISKIEFPKTMKWERSGFRFARPIRNITALLGDKIIRFKIADIQSSDETLQSHIRDDLKIKVKPENYLKKLSEHGIILDQVTRKEMIEELLSESAKNVNAHLVKDKELLDTVSNLVENPLPVLGNFPEKFLKLPDVIVITALKNHQKDFSCEDENGVLLPYFISVADNLKNSSIDIVREGNEKIVSSRLEDAYFYFHEDTKSELFSLVSKLSHMTYREGLGTLKDKTERLTKLVLFLKNMTGSKADIAVLERSALLSKADMATLMIRDGKEFTALQGTIGKYYALESGEKKEVAEAIEEQYKPKSIKDTLPETDQGIILSLSDRMDHITGFLCLLGAPTGSADPYALRRSANTLIHLLIEKKLHVDMDKWMDFNIELYNEQNFLEKENKFSKLKSFLTERLVNYLKDRGYRYDVVNSAVRTSYSDPLKAFEIADALSEFRDDRNFVDLVIAYKRASRILEDREFDNKIDRELFQSDYEHRLYEKFKKISSEVEISLKQKNYSGTMNILLTLKKEIDDFFDNVMVNVEDQKLEINRKNLLYKIVGLFRSFAYLEEIVVEGDEKKK